MYLKCSLVTTGNWRNLTDDRLLQPVTTPVISASAGQSQRLAVSSINQFPVTAGSLQWLCNCYPKHWPSIRIPAKVTQLRSMAISLRLALTSVGFSSLKLTGVVPRFDDGTPTTVSYTSDVPSKFYHAGAVGSIGKQRIEMVPDRHQHMVPTPSINNCHVILDDTLSVLRSPSINLAPEAVEQNWMFWHEIHSLVKVSKSQPVDEPTKSRPAS